MKETIEKLMSAPELDTYQGNVTEDQLSAIESQTGCVLPPDYVEFLRVCGFAFWTGFAVNGAFDENDPRFPKSYNFSAITQTKRAREAQKNSKYPHYDNSVVIGKDDMGGYFLLVSAADRSSPRVVWVDLDEDWVVTKSWDSFESFLKSQLANH